MQVRLLTSRDQSQWASSVCFFLFTVHDCSIDLLCEMIVAAMLQWRTRLEGFQVNLQWENKYQYVNTYVGESTHFIKELALLPYTVWNPWNSKNLIRNSSFGESTVPWNSSIKIKFRPVSYGVDEACCF